MTFTITWSDGTKTPVAIRKPYNPTFPKRGELLRMPFKGSEFALTKNLYLVTFVSLSLVESLKQQHLLNALYWANEMHESGLTHELWCLLWNTYIDWFAINDLLYARHLKVLYRNKDWKRAVCDLCARTPTETVRSFTLEELLVRGKRSNPVSITPANADTIIDTTLRTPGGTYPADVADNWLYYASFTPYWLRVIQAHRGWMPDRIAGVMRSSTEEMRRMYPKVEWDKEIELPEQAEAVLEMALNLK